jgi:glutathione-regulated potassium-efflux system ancillary protein KefG
MELAPFETSDDPNEATNSTRRILVLFAHPSLDRSEVNRPMAEAVRDLDGITLVDLYAEYADFQIDIDREQQRLLEHDVIVFQHPLYWYSTPAIMKEWQDLVL